MFHFIRPKTGENLSHNLVQKSIQHKIRLRMRLRPVLSVQTGPIGPFPAFPPPDPLRRPHLKAARPCSTGDGTQTAALADCERPRPSQATGPVTHEDPKRGCPFHQAARSAYFARKGGIGHVLTTSPMPKSAMAGDMRSSDVCCVALHGVFLFDCNIPKYCTEIIPGQGHHFNCIGTWKIRKLKLTYKNST